MVKIEDCDKNGAVSAGAKVLGKAGVDPQSNPTHASVKVEKEGQPSSSPSNLRSQFIAMGFSPMIVDKMLQKNGDHDSNTILESLLSHSAHQNSGSESSSSLGSFFDSENEEIDSLLVSGIETNKDKKGMVKSLHGEIDKMVSLLEMGFAEEEVSSAIDCFGQEATVEELADSIFARRIANTIEQKQVKIESDFVGEPETEYSAPNLKLSYYDDGDGNKRIKKAKHQSRDDRRASSSCAVNTPWLSGCVRSLSNGSMKEEGNVMASGSGAKVHGDLAKPPYFLYGNVVDISKDTWQELSRFLFSVQPEFVNSRSFSALSRKEGYIHNLPTERRHVLGPNSPMTIQDAVPFTIEDPMQPHQMEQVLGYASGHTDKLGLNPRDRIAAMRSGFQTDTVGHLLSVLKDIYPDGLRVLSIYSGVGGVEVALHRLGIPLKCVVSVEESEVNRKILKQWWGKTKQAGQLRQLSSIKKLTSNLLEDLMNEFRGFDLVVGGTYSSCGGGRTVSSTMGMDAGQFFEYVRVVQRVRSMHGLK